MIEEKSAGAVVFFNDGKEVLYLLLHYEEGHWGFPKGHVEKGETLIETAKREIIEETGLEVKIIDGFNRSTKYAYSDARKKYIKTVFYFIALAEDKKVILSDEHTEFLWLPYNEAVSKLSFQSTKRILELANNYYVSTLE